MSLQRTTLSARTLFLSRIFLIWSFLAAFSGPAFAEALDDDSIAQLYAQTEAVVGNAEKSRVAMEANLADHYRLHSHLTQLIGDQPPTIHEATYGKRELIENALRGYSVMHVDHYRKDITGIQFSADLAFAFVTTRTSSSGVITIPGSAVKKIYEDGEGCIDQLTVIGNKLKLVQSSCNEHFVIKK